MGVRDLSTLISSPPECPVLPSACPQGLSLGLARHPAGRCGLPLIALDIEERRMIRKEERLIGFLCTYTVMLKCLCVRKLCVLWDLIFVGLVPPSCVATVKSTSSYKVCNLFVNTSKSKVRTKHCSIMVRRKQVAIIVHK